eukprot:SAG31_NODE_3582_length_4100_cov_3.424394_3_plen_71_part_00
MGTSVAADKLAERASSAVAASCATTGNVRCRLKAPSIVSVHSVAPGRRGSDVGGRVPMRAMIRGTCRGPG